MKEKRKENFRKYVYVPINMRIYIIISFYISIYISKKTHLAKYRRRKLLKMKSVIWRKVCKSALNERQHEKASSLYMDLVSLRQSLLYNADTALNISKRTRKAGHLQACLRHLAEKSSKWSWLQGSWLSRREKNESAHMTGSPIYLHDHNGKHVRRALL